MNESIAQNILCLIIGLVFGAVIGSWWIGRTYGSSVGRLLEADLLSFSDDVRRILQEFGPLKGGDLRSLLNNTRSEKRKLSSLMFYSRMSLLEEQRVVIAGYFRFKVRGHIIPHRCYRLSQHDWGRLASRYGWFANSPDSGGVEQ